MGLARLEVNCQQSCIPCGGSTGELVTLSLPDSQFSSVSQSCPILCDPMDCDSLSNTNSWSLLKLVSIESVMPSNHLILCRPFLLLPSIFPSIRVFTKESALYIRWPKYWSVSFSISPSNEYSELISFKMDWFDLLAVQGTLKILLQHYSSKASVFQCSIIFIVQLSHPYMTTGKRTQFQLLDAAIFTWFKSPFQT